MLPQVLCSPQQPRRCVSHVNLWFRRLVMCKVRDLGLSLFADPFDEAGPCLGTRQPTTHLPSPREA